MFAEARDVLGQGQSGLDPLDRGGIVPVNSGEVNVTVLDHMDVDGSNVEEFRHVSEPADDRMDPEIDQRPTELPARTYADFGVPDSDDPPPGTSSSHGASGASQSLPREWLDDLELSMNKRLDDVVELIKTTSGSSKAKGKQRADNHGNDNGADDADDEDDEDEEAVNQVKSKNIKRPRQGEKKHRPAAVNDFNRTIREHLAFLMTGRKVVGEYKYHNPTWKGVVDEEDQKVLDYEYDGDEDGTPCCDLATFRIDLYQDPKQHPEHKVTHFKTIRNAFLNHLSSLKKKFRTYLDMKSGEKDKVDGVDKKKKDDRQAARRSSLYDRRLHACSTVPGLKRHHAIVKTLSVTMMSDDETDIEGSRAEGHEQFRILRVPKRNAALTPFLRLMDQEYVANKLGKAGSRPHMRVDSMRFSKRPREYPQGLPHTAWDPTWVEKLDETQKSKYDINFKNHYSFTHNVEMLKRQSDRAALVEQAKKNMASASTSSR
ncbi:hypothetical protein EWM64_g6693 [Hericium alpestre]|uniref:Uncharacterized protein n=1 Tax=Hericium alpestre TaxID=135208 RepID=A0A4Y9ZU12_9AGAM|nr:hypothetical protein EWM64_g6693 [Hericium alpestre]